MRAIEAMAVSRNGREHITNTADDQSRIVALCAIVEPDVTCGGTARGFGAEDDPQKIGAASLRPLHTIPVILDGAALRVSQDAESPDLSDRLPSEGS